MEGEAKVLSSRYSSQHFANKMYSYVELSSLRRYSLSIVRSSVPRLESSSESLAPSPKMICGCEAPDGSSGEVSFNDSFEAAAEEGLITPISERC